MTGNSERFSHLYNLDGLKTVLLTADVDWAPDFAIEFLLSEFEKLGLKLTLFATHDSPILRASPKWCEIGLHPDFTRVSGKEDFRGKFERLLTYYPDAVGTRSHRNLFGQNTCELAAAVGLKYDLSHTQFQVPGCQAFEDQYGLVRASYSWEDGLHCDYEMPMDISGIDFHSKGLKIFNFHPLLFYLNCTTDQDRRQAVQGVGALNQMTESALQPHVRTGRGIQNVARELLTHLKEREVQFLLGREAFCG